jgi:hypothetical protein
MVRKQIIQNRKATVVFKVEIYAPLLSTYIFQINYLQCTMPNFCLPYAKISPETHKVYQELFLRERWPGYEADHHLHLVPK